ncbi:MAG TPA: LuxR family transcriptional regulator [Microvirga sp.]|nr:LuxR family transcriptional regulator [Microvirga sp.]
MPISETHLRQFSFDCVERLSRLTTLEDVSAELRGAGDAFGFGTFCISGLPNPEEKLDPYVILSGWPEGWMERYAGEGYVHVDPVIRCVRQTTMPFAWHEAPYDPDDGEATKVMNEAVEFGLADGLAVPIYTTHGFQAIVTFGADRMALGRDERAGLHLVAIYAHSQARAILSRQQGSPTIRAPKLSPREIECLKWTAAGKTTWEISVILGLSNRTVDEYLASAASKLGAVNRVQTVAEALRRSMIT